MSDAKGTTHEELMEILSQSEEFRKQQRLIKVFYKVAADVVKLRNALGLTQKELAERAETHQTRISKIESGELDIRLSTLAQLAEALECQIAISFVPILKPSTFSQSDEPYQALFGTKTQILSEDVSRKFDTGDSKYSPVSIMGGTSNG